jgi:hypothetical protein
MSCFGGFRDCVAAGDTIAEKIFTVYLLWIDAAFELFYWYRDFADAVGKIGKGMKNG